MSEETTTEAPATPTTVDDLKPGMAVSGTITRLALYGAFVDVGVGQDALLHVSQLGETVRNIEDKFNVGDSVDVFVLKVDNGRVALSSEKPPAVTWDTLHEGMVVTGTVTRIEKFGAFVDIGAERPGMVHVSELADGYVKDPADVVNEGQEVSVRILKVNKRQRKIDLSMREPEPEYTYEEEEEEDLPTAMMMAFRRAQESQDPDDRGRGRKTRASKRRRDAQDDIIARTLRNRHDD